jgi:hypothetical protein
MNLELEADGRDFRGNPEVPRRLVAGSPIGGNNDPALSSTGTRSANCDRSSSTASRLCPRLATHNNVSPSYSRSFFSNPPLRKEQRSNSTDQLHQAFSGSYSRPKATHKATLAHVDDFQVQSCQDTPMFWFCAPKRERARFRTYFTPAACDHTHFSSWYTDLLLAAVTGV